MSAKSAARAPGLPGLKTGPRIAATLLAGLLLVMPGCGQSKEPDQGPASAVRPATPPGPSAAGAHAPAKSEATRVRQAAHAGSWYPADPEMLRREIQRRVEAHPAAPGRDPVLALVGPHAGLRYSGEVAGAAYAQLNGQNVRRVFLLGPSHHAAYPGIALPAPDLRAYATPLGELPIDRETVERLRGQPGFQGPPQAHDPEHSLEMHAIFIAATLPEAEIVPLVVGRVPDSQAAHGLAGRIRPLLRRDDLVIVSSDFTHYGPRFSYVPFQDRVPERLDALADAAAQPLLAVDLDGFTGHLATTRDTICGREPIRVLLALLSQMPKESTQGEEVGRDTSGGLTGDYSHSVSYLSVAYRSADGWAAPATTPPPETGGAATGDAVPRAQQERDIESSDPGNGFLEPEAERRALEMARRTLEIYFQTGRLPSDADLGVPEQGPLRETRAAFVTLKRDGQLRGCIGHIWPVQPLWCDIRDNAIAAAVKDRRFPPVTADELRGLQLEVSVLTPPRAISGPDRFEVGRHGIVLQALGRRAVFLPQVAPEQGWDRETTLTYLARKAGLSPLSWQLPEARLEVFEAQVFSENPPSL